MTTASSSGNTPMSDYFSFQPLLGGDPLLMDVDGGVDDTAWDADLQPDEYGDQSSWDDDNASFTDSEYEDDDDVKSHSNYSDDKVGNDDKDDEEEWSIVYAASITVVACSNATMTTRQGVQDNEEEKCEMHLSTLSHGPPPANPLQRRDSKVRFCEEPPKVVSYEQYSREDYPELYYSVHELQKIIDELRVETTKKTIVKATTITTATTTTGSKTPTSSSSSGQPSATAKTASKVGSMTPSRST